MKKKIAAIVLAFAMAFGGTAAWAQADEAVAKDYSGHWAEDVIDKMVERGSVPTSMQVEFRPDEAISRIEFLNMINGFFGYKSTCEFSFSDVEEESPYAGDIGRAVWMGYAEGYGDGSFRPLGQITRAEAAKMISLIFEKKAKDQDLLSGYSDNADIRDWSREALAFSVEKGYISGYCDGRLRPNYPMTRAEALVFMDRVCGRVFRDAGVYGPKNGTETIEGNATIVSEGVELRNMDIEGDIHVTAGLGEGEALFSGVSVAGDKHIKGGGEKTLDCFAEDASVLAGSDVSIPGMWGFEISGVAINVERGTVSIERNYMEDDATIARSAAEDAKSQESCSIANLPDDASFVSFDVMAPREGKLFKAVAYQNGRAAEYDTGLLDYEGDENSRGYVGNAFVIFEMDEDGNPIVPDWDSFEVGIVYAWYYEDGSVERTSFVLECK